MEGKGLRSGTIFMASRLCGDLLIMVLQNFEEKENKSQEATVACTSLVSVFSSSLSWATAAAASL